MSEKQAARAARTHGYARTKRNQRVGGRVVGVVHKPSAEDKMVARLAKQVLAGKMTAEEALDIVRLMDDAGVAA